MERRTCRFTLPQNTAPENPVAQIHARAGCTFALAAKNSGVFFAPSDNKLFCQRCPRRIIARRLDHCADKAHTFDSVRNSGYE